MLNLSLSGCGFLGIYHIGVISAFREHAPEIIHNGKMSGCSAGALVAACAASDCCLGQMVSDTLEIAMKARSNALGPLHPSFSIVDILRNGLRRILPIDAHKRCSNRVHISLTRWRDGKNFLVNQFDTREELIQALICSSFVPMYSGFVPPKFKGTYFWDGGLSNNHPILDQDTILVSPFGGEADICPRDESASYYCYDFHGTNLQWSYENIYRISKALFPPDPQILKAMCFRGYKDAINFLKSRNLLKCSCYKLKEKTSISSVLGEDLHAYSMYDEMEDENETSVYDSEEDNIMQYAQSNPPLNYQEMPTAVCEILDAACDDDKGLINYVYHSQLSRAISIIFLPWSLPVEFSYNFTKRVLELLPKIKVAPNSTSLIDTLLLFLNYIIHKFTYDRYQYHSRVTCKLCDHHQSLNASIRFDVCSHGSKTNNADAKDKLSICDNNENDVKSLDGSRTIHNFYYPKICARHRVPSLCSSETASLTSAKYKLRKTRRNTSHVSNTSDLASSVDLNEYKSSKSFFMSRRKKYEDSSLSSRGQSKKSLRSSEKLNIEDKNENIELNHKIQFMFNSQQQIQELDNQQDNQLKSKVHFHLNQNSDDEENVNNTHKTFPNDVVDYVSESINQKLFNVSSQNKFVADKYLNNDDKFNLFNHNEFEINNKNQATGPIITEPDEEQPTKNQNQYKAETSSPNIEELNNNQYKEMEWNSYFDNLELNALGRVNFEF